MIEPGAGRVSTVVDVIPAIDISEGRVARARASDPTDPIAAAAALVTHGARWLHVVDVDRAFGRGRRHDAMIGSIARSGAAVQLGGGLDTLPAVREALTWGVRRVVLGIGASGDRGRLGALADAVGGEHLVVGLDARAGRLASRRGAASALPTVDEAAGYAINAGIDTVLYRDLDRDGTLGGADWRAAERLAQMGLKVIVAGGVASLDELHAARNTGIAAVVVGRAFLAGRFTIAEALACCR